MLLWSVSKILYFCKSSRLLFFRERRGFSGRAGSSMCCHRCGTGSDCSIGMHSGQEEEKNQEKENT